MSWLDQAQQGCSCDALTGNWVLTTDYCFPALNRFTYNRTAPGTPAGN